ncbi:trypsin-like peptidase domain-containing protein [Viridibacillus sp. YIM B01967]|uniref:Trypsin-like peptidase domain-containing protein n=1 Tax=Viridibacillus soli TaxID=2798301 RepID=A0ABS1H5Y0_9BACL|nr:trypsin-like peptidase domain-containing protein [Viridibacillus soli]MBK3494801.1 trypsin-like peptidase domain-containing protein [Viridibacillus soli]
MDDNRRYKPKKTSFKRVAASVILIIAVIAGIYTLLTKNDEATDVPDVKVQEVQKTTKNEEPEDDEDDIKTDQQEGTVTKGIDGSTTNEDSTDITMPKNDTSAIIANAKTQVYTVYTDLQQGSGFLFNRKGDIITNAHVVKDASYVFVSNEHGQEFQGQVIGISEKTDIALIRVPGLQGKDPLVLDTAKVNVKTPVIAIGSPNNKGGTSTEGEISSIGASFTDEYTYSNLYEITARLDRGSSGGPLVNARTGNVIGINSIILTDQPEIGYAIPVYSIMQLISQWANKEVEIKLDDDEDYDHKKDAYLDKKLIKDYIDGYYELFPYAIKDKNKNYYETYLLPNSSAATTAKELIADYSSKDKKYQDLKYTVGTVNIHDEYATANVNSIYTYKDAKTGVQRTIKQSIQYTIVIDDYGDYQITKIDILSSKTDQPTSGTGDKNEDKDEITPPTDVEEPDEEDDVPVETQGTGTKDTDTPAKKEPVESIK